MEDVGTLVWRSRLCGAPHPVIVARRDTKEYIRAFFYSYYTIITGWGVLPRFRLLRGVGLACLGSGKPGLSKRWYWIRIQACMGLPSFRVLLDPL